MRVSKSGLYIDNPSAKLLDWLGSYEGVTTANGNVLGTTVVCDGLATEPSYVPGLLKILDGPAAGQSRPIAVQAGNTVTVAAAFTDLTGAVAQITAGTRFIILTLTGGGGVPPVSPGIGLWMFGVVDPAQVASTTVLSLTNLAGFPNDIFNNEFWIQVIHNASAPGTAPEREIRRVTDYVGGPGTFTTDAFSANVEANDLVAVFHESIMALEVMGFGTLTTSSLTVPADAGRAALYPWENNGFFRGAYLMPTEGAARFQMKPIINYTTVGGIFTLDPSDSFSVAPGLVDYIIISGRYPSILGANQAASNYDSSLVAADRDGSLVHRLEWLIAALSGDVTRLPGLTETWQDVLGIDFTVWNVAVTGTGTVARSVAEEPYQKVVLTGPANGDTARIRSVQQWQVAPDVLGTNSIQKRLIVEWEARFVLVASINNPTFFMGLANIAAATRASTNIVGFILTADVLNSITDDGGAETVKAVGAPVLTNLHKYRIEVDAGRVRFYIDEALVATHTTAAAENLPDVNSFLQFYLPQEAAANGGELHVSTVRINPEALV